MRMSDPDVKPLSKFQVYALQILFAISISIGSQSGGVDDAPKLLGIVARYIIYLYLIRGSRECIVLAYGALHSRSVNVRQLYRDNQKHWIVFGAAVAAAVYWRQRVFGEDFLLLLVAHLLVQYPDVEKAARTVTYGTGMACSFFEGYLTHIIPSDGYRFFGFEENIRCFEMRDSIRFPVKRLFIVVTKTLYCPPDLKQLDENLEACRSLEDVMKDVAGVKNRTYRNSAYKILRAARRPVYLAVECATPLHTLHRVLSNRALYEELDGINEAEVVSDFVSMLRSILAKSPACQNKCEIVYFDNTDPTQSLSEVLLERIRQIAPNFEELITEE